MKPLADVAATAVDTVVFPALRAKSSDFLALTKPRLNLLVLVTALGAMYLAAPDGVPPLTLVHALVGTALVAAGATAQNKLCDSETD